MLQYNGAELSQPKSVGGHLGMNQLSPESGDAASYPETVLLRGWSDTHGKSVISLPSATNHGLDLA